MNSFDRAARRSPTPFCRAGSSVKSSMRASQASFSIFTVCKNAARTIRRCAESVLALDLPGLQYVVQDGDSRDGTKDILREIAAHDARLDLVSEPDGGPAEGFLRAVRRCRGSWILSCAADESLCPEAGPWARRATEAHPDAGAIYGDLVLTDLAGNTMGELRSAPSHDFLRRYLTAEVVPPFAATCFRREALDAIGLHTRDWRLGCIEFEIWARLAQQFAVVHQPGFVSRYAQHDTSLTRADLRSGDFLKTRLALLEEMFAAPLELRWLKFLESEAIAGQYLWWVESLVPTGAFDEARRYLERALQLSPNKRRLADVMDSARQKGVALLGAGQVDEALACLELAAAAGLTLPGLQAARARSLEALGRPAEAVRAAQAELEIQPLNDDCKRLLLRLDRIEQSQPAERRREENIGMDSTLSHARESFLAEAWFRQRRVLADAQERIHELCAAVDHPTDLHPFQWAHLMSFALEFRPDLILELGRGAGNSTCAFTEVANRLRPAACDVVSVCLSDDWFRTAPRAAQVVPAEWWAPLHTFRGNILTVPYAQLFAGRKRVMVFWDAHGFDVAECVLGEIAPLLADRSHAILMHDISDLRHMPDRVREYGERSLWRGNNWSGPRVCIGDVDSAVEQSISILDFTTRNRMTLFSADHSLATVLSQDEPRLAEMRRVLGPELVRLDAHWRWFTLEEHAQRKTFPKYTPPQKQAPAEVPLPVNLHRRGVLAEPAQTTRGPEIAQPQPVASARSIEPSAAGNPFSDTAGLQLRIGLRMGARKPISVAELETAADALATLLDAEDIEATVRRSWAQLPEALPPLLAEVARARRATGDSLLADRLDAIHQLFVTLREGAGTGSSAQA
jgi:tetratricopeptide (TPR) repeat protein